MLPPVLPASADGLVRASGTIVVSREMSDTSYEPGQAPA
jgi:hypothetical protein